MVQLVVSAGGIWKQGKSLELPVEVNIIFHSGYEGTYITLISSFIIQHKIGHLAFVNTFRLLIIYLIKSLLPPGPIFENLEVAKFKNFSHCKIKTR